jgi:hypothetical protein
MTEASIAAPVDGRQACRDRARRRGTTGAVSRSPELRLGTAREEPVAFDEIEAASRSTRDIERSGSGERDRCLQSAGSHELVWRGDDEAGRIAPAGVYVAKLTAASCVRVRRFGRIR